MTRDDIYLVLVTGSRKYRNCAQIESDLLKIQRREGCGVVVIHGNCEGADSVADAAAQNCGMNVGRFPANWDHQPTSMRPGPLRNSIIGALFEFDEVLSYPLPGSKGTHDMVSKARLRKNKEKRG